VFLFLKDFKLMAQKMTTIFIARVQKMISKRAFVFLLQYAALTVSLATMPQLGFAQASQQNSPQPALPTTRIKAGMFVITAEVAKEPSQRAMGLMWREKMPADHGMLFVFDRADGHCFWMRNTPLPLTIAWITDDGTIVSLADMQPKSEQSHCPSVPARFALEMNQGWFAKKGLKQGSKLRAEGLFGPK
jgi:uncharacterized membrane protein (UPF0127 family)